MRDQDEKQVFGPKHVRLPNDPKGSPGVELKSREDYVKLKFQGNVHIIGRKKNNVGAALDFWKTAYNTKGTQKGYDARLQELAGAIKDKAPCYDLRRLSTLKFFLI